MLYRVKYYICVMIFLNNNITITYMQQSKKNNLLILANRIKKLRLEQSKSLNKFCFSRGDVTSATWSRIENALVDPKFSTLIEICNMLNITLADLFCEIPINYDKTDN